jgi:hypothetical protein
VRSIASRFCGFLSPRGKAGWGGKLAHFIAFSSEVGTGSREENASNKKAKTSVPIQSEPRIGHHINGAFPRKMKVPFACLRGEGRSIYLKVRIRSMFTCIPIAKPEGHFCGIRVVCRVFLFK